MNYFNISEVEEIRITFENMQQCYIEGSFIQSLGIERTGWPGSPNIFSTKIILDKEVYRSPDILERLRRYRDITWVDVAYKYGRKPTCTWSVPWIDDPEHEDENLLQRKMVELPSGVVIYIDDYNY